MVTYFTRSPSRTTSIELESNNSKPSSTRVISFAVTSCSCKTGISEHKDSLRSWTELAAETTNHALKVARGGVLSTLIRILVQRRPEVVSAHSRLTQCEICPPDRTKKAACSHSTITRPKCQVTLTRILDLRLHRSTTSTTSSSFPPFHGLTISTLFDDPNCI